VSKYQRYNCVLEKEAWTKLPGEAFSDIIQLGKCDVFLFCSIGAPPILELFQELCGKHKWDCGSTTRLRNNSGYGRLDVKPIYKVRWHFRVTTEQ
jgi:hypothetical protein